VKKDAVMASSCGVKPMSHLRTRSRQALLARAQKDHSKLNRRRRQFTKCMLGILTSLPSLAALNYGGVHASDDLSLVLEEGNNVTILDEIVSLVDRFYLYRYDTPLTADDQRFDIERFKSVKEALLQEYMLLLRKKQYSSSPEEKMAFLRKAAKELMHRGGSFDRYTRYLPPEALRAKSVTFSAPNTGIRVPDLREEEEEEEDNDVKQEIARQGILTGLLPASHDSLDNGNEGKEAEPKTTFSSRTTTATKSVSPARIIRKRFRSGEVGEEQSEEMRTTAANIAVIRVRYFGQGTARALAEEIERISNGEEPIEEGEEEGADVMPSLRQQQQQQQKDLQQGTSGEIEEIVIDLRHNKGGNLQEAIAAASLFLEPGSRITYLIDSASSRLESATTMRTKRRGGSEKPWHICLPPIVILVDRATASAAEVFATALKDNCRAVVVGRRTYGKARIQSVFQLSDGSGLQLTVGGYMTPNHDDINRVGFLPDVELTPFENKAESRIPSPHTVTKMLNSSQARNSAKA